MRSKATAAMVKYRKLVDIKEFDSWTWDELVKAAQKASAMRDQIEEIVTTTYGDYIARLSVAKAVKRGDLKQFCEEAGLNYGTVKNWRSRYLDKEQLRQYQIRKPQPEPKPEPEEQRIVTVDDNSENEPEFTDMFDGSTRMSSELVEDEPEEPVVDAQIQSSMAKRTLLRSRIESAIDNHGGEAIEQIIVYFHNGSSLSVRGTFE